MDAAYPNTNKAHRAVGALWRIGTLRMATDVGTRAHVDRRMKEGKPKAEAIRFLKPSPKQLR